MAKILKPVNNISTRKCGLDKETLKRLAGETPVPVLRVVGKTYCIEEEKGDKGLYHAFIGDFKGTNLDTGQEYRSFKCFLPEVISLMLINQFRESSEQKPINKIDESTGEVYVSGTKYTLSGMVNIGIVIAVVKSDNAVGYEFDVEPLVEFSDVDPFAQLEHEMGLKTLKAPESEKKTKK